MVPRTIQTAAVAAILLAPGCVTSSPPNPYRHAVAPHSTAQCRIFVMWPVSAPSAFRGNVVVHPPEIESLVARRIVEVERERCPDSELVRPSRATTVAAIPGYAAAVNRTSISALTTFELQAAASALDRGANYLVVPTIEQWNQNRTDDPIGAFVSPRNRIAISLRLMRLRNPVVTACFRFTNRALVTLNQPAARLLDNRFDLALRTLSGDSGTYPQCRVDN